MSLWSNLHIHDELLLKLSYSHYTFICLLWCRSTMCKITRCRISGHSNKAAMINHKSKESDNLPISTHVVGVKCLLRRV